MQNCVTNRSLSNTCHLHKTIRTAHHNHVQLQTSNQAVISEDQQTALKMLTSY